MTINVSVPAEQSASFFDTIKRFWTDFDIKKWSTQIGGSAGEAVEAVIYFGLFFAVGFLFKKYFKMLFVCCIIAILMIKGMEYAKFLTIDWTAIQTYFGFTSGFDFNILMNQALEWIKAHLLVFIASTVGFLIGYKLG